ILKGEALTLERICLDGSEIGAENYVHKNDELTLSNVPAGPFTLEIETVVAPAANRALTGLYLSNGVYCTQCEAEGFRRITFHPDRPDVLSVYTTRIEAPKAAAPVLLSNGNLVEAGENGDRHFAVWHDPFPKPSYLFALVGGDLAMVEDGFKTMSGRNVGLKIYVEQGKSDRASYALEALKRAMAWDEEAFGREYDLDLFMIVAVSDFNMGAMENKGLNVFNDRYVLASPETATDTDYANIEAVIAHEYFHNWTGNRITCRDWFQLCLKEGLTVFRDQEFTSTVRSRPVKRIGDVRTLRNQQFPEDSGPLSHPVRPSSYIEINNFYTATVYEKGAEVIRVLKTLIGADHFAAGMELYFARHDGEAATVEDFISCMQDASGRDLSQFMLWYTQAGTPRLRVEARHDADTRTLTVDFTQSTAATPGQNIKSALVMPLAIGALDNDGHDLALVGEDGQELERGIVELAQEHTQLKFAGIAAPPVLSLNRGFSVPVELDFEQSASDLIFAMAHDSDPFNRWQVGQNAASALMISMIDDADATSSDVDAFAQALGRALTDEVLEPAFRAEIGRLPSEPDIAREIGMDVDTDAIHGARARLRHQVGSLLETLLDSLLELHLPRGAYSPDASSAGQRALANTALDLICAGSGDGARAHQHFETSQNMTDRMAALTILKDLDVPQREQALDCFYEMFSEDNLVVDKWLGLQAASTLPKTLASLKSLMEHTAFTIDNPNRIRALVGTFAMANQVRFNQADGSGYDFLADFVLELDPRNPQVAARLLGAFKSWRILEPGRRALAAAALG
ncbi:MAG: aminopeptidase N, partial [Rhizobiales bacterium]|nr:aminopeptidase N [Hyphomicrobiales bacterium]